MQMKKSKVNIFLLTILVGILPLVGCFGSLPRDSGTGLFTPPRQLATPTNIVFEQRGMGTHHIYWYQPTSETDGHWNLPGGFRHYANGNFWLASRSTARGENIAMAAHLFRDEDLFKGAPVIEFAIVAVSRRGTSFDSEPATAMLVREPLQAPTNLTQTRSSIRWDNPNGSAPLGWPMRFYVDGQYFFTRRVSGNSILVGDLDLPVGIHQISVAYATHATHLESPLSDTFILQIEQQE